MLKEYLSKIADAIRSVLGTTDPINAQDFPDKIEEVYETGRQEMASELSVEKNTVTGTGSVYLADILKTPHMVEVQLSSDTLTDFSAVSVQSSGRNMLDKNFAMSYLNNPTGVEFNGITFVRNPDDSITMNGTALKDETLTLSNKQIVSKGTYTLFGCFGGSSETYWFQTRNGFRDVGNGVIISVSTDISAIYLKIAANAVFENVTIFPMLVYGNVLENLPKYEPYRGMTYQATADGRAEVLSIAPVMHIATEDGLNVSATHYKSSAQSSEAATCEFTIENHNATGVSISYTSVEGGQVVTKVAEDTSWVDDVILCGGTLVLVTYSEGFEPIADGFELLGEVYTQFDGDNAIVYTYKAPDEPETYCCIDY